MPPLDSYQEIVVGKGTEEFMRVQTNFERTLGTVEVRHGVLEVKLEIFLIKEHSPYIFFLAMSYMYMYIWIGPHSSPCVVSTTYNVNCGQSQTSTNFYAYQFKIGLRCGVY